MSRAEQDRQKLDVISKAAEVMSKKLSHEALDFIVESLGRYSVEAIKKAAKILVVEEQYFSVKALTDIIIHNDLERKPEINQSGIIYMTDEEYEIWRHEMERRDMGLTEEEYAAYLKECDAYWADHPPQQV